MSAHKPIKFVVRQGFGLYLLIAADGKCYTVNDDGVGQFEKTVSNPVAHIRATAKIGRLVHLETLPPRVYEYVNSLNVVGRFPKCFDWLPDIKKGGISAVHLNVKSKQMLNELCQHGLVKKTKANNYILA